MHCGRKATSKVDMHMGLPDFMTEVLLVVLPALASIVWTSLIPVILTSMIITGEELCSENGNGLLCPSLKLAEIGQR